MYSDSMLSKSTLFKCFLFVLMCVNFTALLYAKNVQETPLDTASVSNAVNSKTSSLLEVKGEQFIVNLAYNSQANFMKRNIYAPFGLNKCYVHIDLQAALTQLDKALKRANLKLVLHDCFRPQEAQEYAFKIMPNPRYVANPKVGSNHSRGIALDVSLANADGEILQMPSGFDEFSIKSASNYICKQNEREKCANRTILQNLMIESGFRMIKSEWWHFELDVCKARKHIEQTSTKMQSRSNTQHLNNIDKSYQQCDFRAKNKLYPLLGVTSIPKP